MISWEVILYAFVCGAMLMLSMLGLESAVVTPSLDRWSKRFFTTFFIVLVLGAATFFLELIAYENPTLTILDFPRCFPSGTFCKVVPTSAQGGFQNVTPRAHLRSA